MRLHVFSGRSCFGFTEDSSGQNLPLADGPWQEFKIINAERGKRGRIGAGDDDILDGIEGQGYYIQRSDPPSNRHPN